MAYAHVPDLNRGKLDDKSEKCIFIGYSEVTKAYKLYNPSTRKVIISRDVLFREDKAWEENERTKDAPTILVDENLEDRQNNTNGNMNQVHTPNQSPPSTPSSSSTSSSSIGSPESSPRKIRSISDIYASIQ